MLNDFIGGGQIFLHKLRMLFQVLNRSFMTALIVSTVILCAISFGPAKKLDWQAAITYQKAWLVDRFEDAMSGVRAVMNPRAKHQVVLRVDAFTKDGLYIRNVEPRKIMRLDRFNRSNAEVLAFLKARLLIGMGIMVGVFALIYVMWSRFGKDVKSEKKKAGSDKVLLANDVRKLLYSKASDFHIGKMPLVKDSETKHFLVTGSTGSGKTNLIHNILPQVQDKKQPVIVIDQTGEMIAKYYNSKRGDIIFNPFDARSKSWDFWTDCKDDEELKRFSKILFGFNRKRSGHSTDPFWEQSAGAVFNSCVKHQRISNNESIEQLYSLLSNASLKSLQAKLGSRYLETENKATASSILSMLATDSKPISYLRDANKEDSFSLKEYFKNIDKGSDKWLFLATKPSSRELTLALLACLVELSFAQLLNIGIKPNRRVWFIIDELSALGKLPALSTLMAEGRKYGACVISGLQSLNQLYSNYGQYEGSTIFGQFGTNFFFRNNEPAIAKMVSNMCGTETIYRQQKNTSFGAHEFRDGVSYSEQQQQKNLVEYSDLANLATGECFALLPEPQVRIVRLQVPEAKIKDKNAGFVQREIVSNLQKKKEQEEDQDIKELSVPISKEKDEKDSAQSALVQNNYLIEDI